MKTGTFSRQILGGRKKGAAIWTVFFLYILVVAAPVCRAGMISDWVVAFVDDEAITNSELQAQYEKTKKVSPDITDEEVLNTMINRMLILREAKKYRIEEPTAEEVIREYVDLKVRAFIRVTETEIETYYRENISGFPGKDYEEAHDEIEQYLTEKDLNRRLKEIIGELRKTAYIKILPKQGPLKK